MAGPSGVALACAVMAACIGSRMEALGPQPAASCRTAVSADGAPRPGLIRWTVSAGDRRALDRWCAAVGPAVVRLDPASPPAGRSAARSSSAAAPGAPSAAGAADSVAVVTWNVHVGGGDLTGFVDSLRAGRLTGGVPVRDFVLLVQEAWRRDTVLVPSPLPAGAKGARRIHEASATGAPVDVVDAARSLGLALVYVPSMRNGDAAAEDRGNAILSTLALREPTSVELPFEAQRRVAVSAVLGEPTTRGRECDAALRVTSAHLDNRSRLGRIFASLGTARVRQARGLIRSLALEPPRAVEVVGGDFNTWRGRTEEVVGIMRQAFPESPKPVHGATHAAGMHLDYLFARGPANAVSGQRKVPGRFGSDHGPILAWARLPGPGACPAAPST